MYRDMSLTPGQNALLNLGATIQLKNLPQLTPLFAVADAFRRRRLCLFSQALAARLQAHRSQAAVCATAACPTQPVLPRGVRQQRRPRRQHLVLPPAPHPTLPPLAAGGRLSAAAAGGAACALRSGGGALSSSQLPSI